MIFVQRNFLVVENDQESNTDVFSDVDGGYNVDDKDDQDVYEYNEKDGDDLSSSHTVNDRLPRGVASVEDQKSNTDVFSNDDDGYTVDDEDDPDVYEYDDKDGDDLPSSHTANDRLSRGVASVEDQESNSDMFSDEHNVTSIEDVLRGSISSYTADLPCTSNLPSTSHQDDDEDTDCYEPTEYPLG
jgi:hypothetical protein